MEKPVPLHTIFEARYERGYRYLDRCGDAMLVLESLLQKISGEPWWPDEMTPTRAKISCPALEASVSFDAYRMGVDGLSDITRYDFRQICESVMATIVGRFDLQKIIRLGYRSICGVVAESIEAAEQLSAKRSPCPNWPPAKTGEFSLVSSEVVNVFEDADRSRGWRLSIGPSNKPEAPTQLDERLRLPSRLLPNGQRDALVKQLNRRRENERDPLACLKIDVDFYQFDPGGLDPRQFIDWARGLEKDIQNAALTRGK